MSTVQLTETYIRLTTTFACRVYRSSTDEWPQATVLRRGDIILVTGHPERVGKFDKFVVLEGGWFILVPRSRWAWV
jgi:Trk K+ transport system NAD-binding subunit